MQQRLCWPGRSGWRRILHPTTDLQHERRIIGMPTVGAIFYGITGSMQTAVGITCVLLGAILLGIFYFFLRKLSLSRPASITALLVLCALPINGFRNEGQMVPFCSAAFIPICRVLCVSWHFSVFQYPVLPEIKRKPADDPEDLSGVACLFVAAVLLNCGGQRCRRSSSCHCL